MPCAPAAPRASLAAVQQPKSLADDPERPPLAGRRLRVAALLPGDDFPGPAGQVASTAEELARRGVDLEFVLLRRPSDAAGRLPSFLERRNLTYHVLEDRGPLDVSLLVRVRRLLRGRRPQILETHGYKPTAIALLLKRLGPDWRWIGFFHGLTSESVRARAYHRMDLWMLSHADRAAAPSEEQRRHLARWSPDAHVIHSAVTTLDVVAAPDAARMLSRVERAARPRIAVIGRLSPEKGADLFVRAAALLQARNVPFSAFLAGDGPERPGLEALAASLGVGDRVQFLGHVADIAELYDHIELLVIPSRSEGLPSVLLEALAADVPVVATRVGAIPEVLRTPGAGVLVTPGSPDALADGVVAALSSRDDPAASAARAAAARAFSQERRADALLALYRDVLTRRGRAEARP